jgi:hypothetical protein
MTIADLKRHYLLRNPKRAADTIGTSLASVYMKADGTRAFRLEEAVQLLLDTKDPTLLEELSSRIGYFVIPQPERHPDEDRLAALVSSLSRKLSRNKRVKPREAEKAGLALLGYSVALRKGGVQRELDLR